MKKIIVSGLVSTALAAAFAMPFISSAAALAPFTAALSYGTQNSAAVAELQQFLIQGGYLNISSATGNFFSGTQTALEAYQKAHGISATGYFGPLTMAAVNAQIVALNTPPATVAIKSISEPNTSLAAAVVSFLTATNPSRTIAWATNGYPANAGVNINIIKKTSDSPAAYSLVRQLATDVPNTGTFSWSPKSGETGNDIYAEVTCASSATSTAACQISANPIQVQ